MYLNDRSTSSIHVLRRCSAHHHYILFLFKTRIYSMNSTLYPDQGTMFAHALRGVETCFTVTMEDSYESKIGHEVFDPNTVFREMATLANELSNVFKTGLTPRQEAAFENHILHSLAWMVYGSNKIEKAGSNSEITLKLCLAIFCGKEVPEEIEEQRPRVLVT
jgi:hypothetical protein